MDSALEIREVEVNGEKFKIQEMCFDDSEEYSEGSAKLSERLKAGERIPIREYNQRNIAAVHSAICGANNGDATVKRSRNLEKSVE